MSGKKRNVMLFVLLFTLLLGSNRSGSGTVVRRDKDNTGGVS